MVSLDKIRQIESSGDPNAYNRRSGAAGLYQITLPVLTDYNKTHNKDYSQNDLFNPEVNKQIADWYLNIEIPRIFKAFNLPNCDMLIIAAYNWGCGAVRKWFNLMPEETQDYLRKYFL